MLSNRTSSALAGTILALAAFAPAASRGGQPPPASAAPQRGDAVQPAPAISSEPAGIAWGPGRELQAGVRARLWAGKQHAGRFIFDVYLRNRTKHALTVTCPSYPGLTVPSDSAYNTEVQSPSIYCTPHLRDSSGRPVSVSFQLSAEDRQFTVAPGQVVYLSHWMLRTMDRQEKRTGRLNETNLIAFVEPGRHRVSCDVSAAWGSQGDRRAALRTGEAAFEVIGEDVAAN